MMIYCKFLHFVRKYFRNHEELKIWFAEPKNTFLDFESRPVRIIMKLTQGNLLLSSSLGHTVNVSSLIKLSVFNFMQS